MFTKAFVIATLERAVKGAAVGASTVLAVSGMSKPLDLALGAVTGFVGSIVLSVGSYGVSPGSPSLTPKAEVDSALAPLTQS